MNSIEQLDLLLGQALENIMGAADEIRSLGLQESDAYIKHIGKATMELWDIRESLYALRPDIKRDFLSELESDPARYEQLSQLHQQAMVAETSGDMGSARTFYQELRERSKYGWFTLLAEAGLYRTSEKGKA